MPPLDDTRERLLEAAGPVFADKGFKAATVREIIEKAVANIAAVNYHFGDKERLYLETVKRAYVCCVEAVPLPDLPPDTTAPVRLALFIRTMVTRMLDGNRPAWHMQLMMRELAQPTPACAEVVQQYIRPQAQVLMGILDELLPDSSLEEKHLIGFSIVGQCFFHRSHRPVIAELVGPEEYAQIDLERVTEHITRFTFAALGLAPPLIDEGGNP